MRRKLIRCPKTKRSRYGLRRKMKISEVSEFSILPYTKNRKLGNLENISLLSNSDSSYNSRFKNDKNTNWAKNGKVLIRLKRKKEKFLRFPSFRFCPIPKIENSEMSEILFTSNLDTGCDSRFKNTKDINWGKN